jgi:hypothetical protein
MNYSCCKIDKYAQIDIKLHIFLQEYQRLSKKNFAFFSHNIINIGRNCFCHQADNQSSSALNQQMLITVLVWHTFYFCFNGRSTQGKYIDFVLTYIIRVILYRLRLPPSLSLTHTRTHKHIFLIFSATYSNEQ